MYPKVSANAAAKQNWRPLDLPYHSILPSLKSALSCQQLCHRISRAYADKLSNSFVANEDRDGDLSQLLLSLSRSRIMWESQAVLTSSRQQKILVSPPFWFNVDVSSNVSAVQPEMLAWQVAIGLSEWTFDTNFPRTKLMFQAKILFLLMSQPDNFTHGCTLLCLAEYTSVLPSSRLTEISRDTS